MEIIPSQASLSCQSWRTHQHSFWSFFCSRLCKVYSMGDTKYYTGRKYSSPASNINEIMKKNTVQFGILETKGLYTHIWGKCTRVYIIWMESNVRIVSIFSCYCVEVLDYALKQHYRFTCQYLQDNGCAGSRIWISDCHKLYWFLPEWQVRTKNIKTSHLFFHKVLPHYLWAQWLWLLVSLSSGSWPDGEGYQGPGAVQAVDPELPSTTIWSWIWSSARPGQEEVRKICPHCTSPLGGWPYGWQASPPGWSELLPSLVTVQPG